VFEDDFSEDDIEKFYEETITGSGGPPPPGRVQELITKYFLWDGKVRRDDVFTAEEHQTAFETMKQQLEDQTWITYGGVKQQTANDGKEWVWLAVDQTVLGPCLQIFMAVPYGRRPLLVAKHNKTDVMFEKVNWAKVDERFDKEIGTLIRTEENTGAQWLEEYGFSPDVFKAAIADLGASAGSQESNAAPPQQVQPPPEPQSEPIAETTKDAVEEVEVVIENHEEVVVEPPGPEISATQLASIKELCTVDGEQMLDASGVTTWEGLRDTLRMCSTGQLKRINEARSLDSSVPKSQKLDNLLDYLRAQVS